MLVKVMGLYDEFPIGKRTGDVVTICFSCPVPFVCMKLFSDAPVNEAPLAIVRS